MDKYIVSALSGAISAIPIIAIQNELYDSFGIEKMMNNSTILIYNMYMFTAYRISIDEGKNNADETASFYDTQFNICIPQIAIAFFLGLAGKSLASLIFNQCFSVYDALNCGFKMGLGYGALGFILHGLPFYAIDECIMQPLLSDNSDVADVADITNHINHNTSDSSGYLSYFSDMFGFH